MAAILARKLGMTQVFLEEDGRVERVTVLEAGPCPVTAIRTAARDGYEPVQLGFGHRSWSSRAGSACSHRENGNRWSVTVVAPPRTSIA